MVRNQTGSDMTFDEMKNCILQTDAENNINPEQFRANYVQQSNRQESERIRQRRQNQCNRCNEVGHWKNNCPLIATGEWFCFACNRRTKHDPRNCPNRIQRYENQNQYSRGIFRGRSRGRGGGWGRGRGNSRGRGNKSYGENRFHPYDQQKNTSNPQANQAGKSNTTFQIENELSFIADSGATEHIIKKGLILKEFTKSEGEEIQSANCNKKANIKIDGRGNLYLNAYDSEKTIHLSNVIAASGISENLLSLRKFVDAGYGIYLDDEKLNVFNKETGEEYITGKYQKPNWIVEFRVQRCEESIEKYDKYTVKANLVSLEDFISQSQTDESNVVVINPIPAEIGREKESKISESAKDITENKIDKSELINFQETLNRKIMDLNEAVPDSELEKMLNYNEEIRAEKSFHKPSEGMLWHMRLGHPSLEYMKKMQKYEEKLKGIKLEKEIQDCETCILAKSEKLPFKNNRDRSDRPLHNIHTDTMGPITPLSFPGENKYIIVFVDDHSRYARTYYMRVKNQSGECLQKYLEHTRNMIGKNEKVCYIRSDNGTEFTGGEFTEIMRKEKISADLAPPYTPELNGTAERFNKSIQQKTRALLIESGLPPSMWILATETAVHVYNRTPHKGLEFKTPLSVLNPNKNSHTEELKRFGCVAYVTIPIPESKFSERAIKTFLVGHTSTGYLLWHPQTNRFINSRHVRFNEKLTYGDFKTQKHSEEQSEPRENLELEKEQSEELRDNTESEKEQREEVTNSEKNNNTEVKQKGRKKRKRTNSDKSVDKIRKLPERRAKTEPKRDPNFVYKIQSKENCRAQSSEESDDEDIFISATIATVNEDPTNFREAMTSKNKEEWLRAIKEELKSMYDNKAWKLVYRPEKIVNNRKTNLLDSRWIFKRKIDENGEVKFKARLVIRGFRDKNNYELRETYAPVSRLTSIRSVLAVINKFDLEAVQLDVKTAFLNGVLENDIYMEIPEGTEDSEVTRKEKVCKLEKAIYGLKVSPKKWYERFTTEANELGLERDIKNPCLFTWRQAGIMLILVLYVDDIILASNSRQKLTEIKTKLCKIFQMKDLGEPKMYLGMRINRDRENKTLTLSQSEYTEKILERFQMKECNAQDSPMITRQVKNREIKAREIQENASATNAPYREAIGCLIYLAGGTRPDISYSVNYKSRKQTAPTEEDWKEVKRILRYLRGTTSKGLTFRAQEEKLEAFTDASFRDCDDSSSTSGYVVKLYGDTVAWRSHKQKETGLSTCLSEYLAMSEVCQEIISLDKALRDMTGCTYYPATIWCDNKSARDCTQMDGTHKLKAFDDSLEEIQRKLNSRESSGRKESISKAHGDFIKKCVNEGKVKVKWISTKENIADIMTKPLPSPSHINFRDKILG